MREAQLVESTVGRDHVFVDPGAVLPGARRVAAGRDHALEGRVHRDRVGRLTLATSERPRHAQRSGSQDHARIGREPQDRVLVVPGEDALRVGGQQTLGREISAVGEQSVPVGDAGIGKGIGVDQSIDERTRGQAL